MSIDKLARQFAESHPNEAARILEGLDAGEAALFLSDEPVETGTRLISAMDPTSAAGCLDQMSAEKAAHIVEALDLELAAALLRVMDPALRKVLLGQLSEDRREPLEMVLKYPDNTAGGLMDPRAVALPRDITLEEGLQRVRRYADRASYYLYVIERPRRLAGVVNIREMMLGDPGQSIGDVMRPSPVRLNVNASLTAVRAHPGWLEFQVLPVVDDAESFVGALRHRTLRRLDSDPASHAGPPGVGGALGELFQIGLTGLAQIAGSGPAHPVEKGRAE